jgi:hypothetical protein
MCKKTKLLFVVAAAIVALMFAAGCNKSQAKLQSAAAAEKSGDYRQAANPFAGAALEAAPTIRLHEAQKGQALQPSVWQSEIEKYMKWLTEPSGGSGAALGEALNGLVRCVEKFESDNTVHTPPPQPLDTLPAFTREWNHAFNPPPPGNIDWGALVKSAHDKKFSILRLTSPMKYVYDVSIVSRKNMHRVNFTLYSESNLYVPLPPADYVMIVKSTVDFQKGEYWSSDYTAFNINVGGEPALITMDVKTKVSRKQ